MSRFPLFAVAVVAACLFSANVRADDPSDLLFVVSNQKTALLLPPLARGAAIGVLIQDRGDDYATVNARAMTMRHATHFVSDGDDSSLLAQLFRERLTNLGAVPIELLRTRSHILRLADTNAKIPTNPSLAHLFAGP